MIVMVFPSIEKKFTLKIINHKIALIVLLTVQLWGRARKWIKIESLNPALEKTLKLHPVNTRYR
jgi:hypothetical protein